MGLQIPWLLVCVSSVPAFMIYTKCKRMDAREMHEIQMRIKYHSEYWKRGNAFVREFQGNVAAQLASTADPLTGRDIASIPPTELAAAEGVSRNRRWWLF
ncbi:hypothetical protein ABB37_06776 [Leptomonas pyrrhocoris]|uniref:Uncharacterized protein n=1 Tax=Leptomonas pyrrhocoris TaxID=157538 RepID=A0A0N0VEH6_LEPPY|nr:hypothetical protein ABB37_06776 [Leptomonas pyrrhocoris]XP_015656463.1 hypothetical protein ABB37_06776 [Leptomonas pyrrhocoris]KPA78023.1 hypothetical protein ABB37_06776 [Leptomonas pyrrhocoris]KPA78024.1 hypothetical protein ABB37_06776 [Leptomonas pyrrhocoris]|eukprot:XP_015656462.1 hypothetical protein ABB37_06776 [Leptomonas pyrrhocoris]